MFHATKPQVNNSRITGRADPSGYDVGLHCQEPSIKLPQARLNPRDVSSARGSSHVVQKNIIPHPTQTTS